jgi:nucleotide-binding universal stress UspA family protein
VSLRLEGIMLENLRDTDRSNSAAPAVVDRDAVAVRRIVLATAGQPSSKGALQLTAALEQRHGASVRVVTVYQPPIPLPLREGEEPHVEPAHQQEIHAQTAAVERAIAGYAGHEWRTIRRIGEHGRCIDEEATRWNADLIVLGLGRADAVQRDLGDRALLRVAAGADRPILAVSADMEKLPGTIVIAVGRNGEVARLSQLAKTIAAEGASVHLVHVREPGEPEDEARHLHATLGWAEAELQRSGFTVYRQEIMRGDPMRRVMSYARRAGAELIVGGLHGSGYAARSMVRNLVLHLAQESRCSVLLVPRAEP